MSVRQQRPELSALDEGGYGMPLSTMTLTESTSLPVAAKKLATTYVDPTPIAVSRPVVSTVATDGLRLMNATAPGDAIATTSPAAFFSTTASGVQLPRLMTMLGPGEIEIDTGRSAGNTKSCLLPHAAHAATVSSPAYRRRQLMLVFIPLHTNSTLLQRAAMSASSHALNNIRIAARRSPNSVFISIP